MEEDSSDSQSLILIRQSDLRAVESNLQAQLDSFDKENIGLTFIETSKICDSVKDQILYHEDEPHLSKTHNNCRRIFIASDLFISICTVYGHIVDNEFTRIINEMVQWEKYKKLSKRVIHKMHLDKKREKFFAKEAKGKLLKTVEDKEGDILEEKEAEKGVEDDFIEDSGPIQRPTEDVEQVVTPMEVLEESLMPTEVREPETAVPRTTERETHPADLEVAETFREAVESAPEAHILESTVGDEILPNISENLTEIRAEPVADISQYPISNISRLDFPVMDAVAETSIREPTAQDKTDDDLSHVLQILEGQNFQKEIADILQPIEPTEIIPEGATVEELLSDGEKKTEEPERSEEWSLPNLEPVKKTRKRIRLIMDEITVIPEYAARAVQMNRNISIERVQVFKGPPSVVQGISVNHLMKTPGFKSSLFQDVRSSKLSELYSRHLELEQRPTEAVLPRSGMEKRRDVSKEIAPVEIIEEVGERVGMRSVPERSDLVTDFQPDKSRQEDLEIPSAPPKESLIGMPMSRIISSTIEPPEEIQMERINAAPILPTPRVQQLQGQTLDPKTTSSWFISSKQDPPSDKYREFNYVYKKLLQYWSLFEIQGMEKCISLREFFSFEADKCVANYLIAMRVIDKLSIQRKILLEFKNNDMLIRPFESPYVTGKQLLLKEKDPIF